jgi:hypothetical protein
MKYESAVLRGGQGAVPVSVDVTGGLTLRLVVTGGDDNSVTADHADWADAKLTCGSGTRVLLPDVSVVATDASGTNAATSSKRSEGAKGAMDGERVEGV